MKMKRLFISLAIVFPFLMMAVPAKASTIGECDTLIGIVKTQLDGTYIGGKNPDRTRAGLESKLSNASIKLNQGKFPDSVQKLMDFGYTVAELAVPNRKNVTKVSPEDADLLVTGTNEAIACVSWL